MPGALSRLKPIALSLSLALPFSMLHALPAFSETTTLNEARAFNVPGGNLDQVLNQFGLEAGLELYLDGALLQGQTSRGLRGQL